MSVPCQRIEGGGAPRVGLPLCCAPLTRALTWSLLLRASEKLERDFLVCMNGIVLDIAPHLADVDASKLRQDVANVFGISPFQVRTSPPSPPPTTTKKPRDRPLATASFPCLSLPPT